MKQVTATPMRRQRLRRGMTQADLAQACKDKGVSASDSQLSKIERGLWTPRPKLRATLAEILELDVKDLQARPRARSK